MKVCFFADSESIHTIRWCNYFKSMGYDVHLISLKSALIEGISVYPLNMEGIKTSGGNWKTLFKYRAVKKLLKEIKPDIFHSLYATSYGITGALCSFHPYIITALGTDILISPKQSRIYRILLRYAFKRTDKITVVAEHMRTAAIELGAKPENVLAIPMGVDQLVFNSGNRKLSEERFEVISTRNFEPIYNIPHLLKAIKLVLPEIPNIHVTLLGAGSLKEELIRMSKDLGIDQHVTFAGKKTQPEMARLLNQSHVFVSLSLSDGNNISLNEGMACGTFNIATDIPANRQWIEDNKNGFLIPVDDVRLLAEKLIETRNRYDELTKQAEPINKQLLEENGIWQNNMKRMEALYHQLVKS
ncbi:glycosyltransferase family 4 protein [Fluviicola chungangensis]|uniref:Glycosyltransferase family 4 protein n=1 Tax=Fluviicola chungangensis TaxID=2597671 RepID=A0A556N0G4_9FLAO|nr:glycosyltransferase family 4 protein [Fluviicola chungangensis]TSJ45677.1 glycosyltransferase family 4 protein [Fluviicola chungangensis]